MFVWILLLFPFCIKAIYEDQVGKFDWRQQYIGCPYQIERAKIDKSDLIIVSSEAKVIAAIKSSTGEIVWRQLLEQNSSFFFVHQKYIVTSENNLLIMRGWEVGTGLLIWETSLFSKAETIVSVIASEKSVFVITESFVFCLSLSKGLIKWSTKLSELGNFIGAAVVSENLIITHGAISKLSVIHINALTGALISIKSEEFTWLNPPDCKAQNGALYCFDQFAFYSIDLSVDLISVNRVPLKGITSFENLGNFGFVGLRISEKVLIYKIIPSTSPVLALTIEEVDSVSLFRAYDNRFLVSAVVKSGSVKVYDLLTQEMFYENSIEDESRAPIVNMRAFLEGRDFEFLTVGMDCRIDFLVGSGSSLYLEWSRHEALSTITSVQLVDLPLSEAQANIESEFSIGEGSHSLWKSFERRLRSQFDQLKRTFFSTITQLFDLSLLSDLLKSKSFFDLNSLMRPSSTQHSRSNKNLPFERDYFNMRKVIVASTEKSVIYGLDSLNGSILWRLYLGRNARPLKLNSNVLSIPLYIQRTTANYQYSPQAAAAFSDEVLSVGCLISFNPISGTVYEKIEFPSKISRIEMLPSVDIHFLHPIIVFDHSNNVHLFPKSIDIANFQPTYFFSYNSSGFLEGSVLDKDTWNVRSVWSSSLLLSAEDRIVAVATKPINQKIHSSGRVLGDRSVLYKYSNPNLIAIAVLNPVLSLLNIYLIDAVSGYIVYIGKQSKISGPIHVVHCENWFAYSYWSEKGRRTEIGIIELYEGLQQGNETHFDSLRPPLPNSIQVISQAYIFPQGISAMGVTETEQGLSSRSLLIAMPFGEIYSLSKRFIDARRPLEMTAELAEEMIIPYRPELPLASEDFINYNQSVFNIRKIKAVPSGLESTTLVLSYGLDIFFTRLTPSGTFDILKDDFDHLLISVVLIGLILASFLCKKFGRSHTLKQAWL